MPKSTAELQASKAGETAESNGFGAQERPWRPAGLYELHDNDGNLVASVFLRVHPKFGDSQAAAFERVGYKFVRPATAEELEGARITPPPADAINGDTEMLKGIQARLAALEDENAKLKKEKEEREAAPAAPATPEAPSAPVEPEKTAKTTGAAKGGGSDSELRAKVEEPAKTEKVEEAKTDDKAKVEDKSEDEDKASAKPPVEPAF